MPPDLVGAVDAVVFEADAQGRWTYLSPAWERLTGRRVADCLGEPFVESLAPEERARTVALFQAVVAGGALHCRHRTRLRTAPGHAGPGLVDLFAQPVRAPDGTVVRNVGVLLDVSDEADADEVVRGHAEVVELVSPSSGAETLPVATVVFDASGAVRRASPSAARLLGPPAAPGGTAEELDALLEDAAEDRGRRRGGVLVGPAGLLATARATGTPRTLLVRTRTTPPRYLHLSVLPARDDPGSVTVVVQDVSALHRAERQQAAVARLGRFALEVTSVVRVLDEAVRVVARALGVPFAVVLKSEGDGTFTRCSSVGWPGRTPQGTWDVAARAGADDVLEHALGASGPVQVASVAAEPSLVRHAAFGPAAAGSAVWTAVDGDGAPYGLLGVLTDRRRPFRADELAFLAAAARVVASAVQRLRAEARTRRQALHDPLTGLANRALLQDRLEHALGLRRRTGGRVALLLMDLDRFKEVNDTLGHGAGDVLLQTTARRLVEAARASDTVARLGGDEFAVVLTDVRDPAAAARTAAKLRAAVAAPVEIAGVTVRVGGSVGVAVAPEHGESPGALLDRADAAMYRAKGSASGVSVHAAAGPAPAAPPGHLAALREAIEGDQLRVHYQPVVDLRDGRVVAREALVRWQHPAEGLLPPADFLPYAERTGLVEPLTRQVLRTALDDARRWRDAGRTGDVAVNLSARDLHAPRLVPHVLAELERAEVPGARLQLEVAEGALTADPDAAVPVLRRLGTAGVRLSLDDFGAGRSALAALADLPLHEIKVDGALVRGLGGGGQARAVVGAVVDMGHRLGVDVVAEGVETTDVCAALMDLGCDRAQGFLLGRPEPLQALLVPAAAG